MAKEWRFTVTDHGEDYSKKRALKRYSAVIILESIRMVEHTRITKDMESGTEISRQSSPERQVLFGCGGDPLWFNAEPDKAAIKAHPEFLKTRGEILSALANAEAQVPPKDVTPANQKLD